MTLDYAWEKFYNAVRTLAITDSDLKSRLTAAAVNQLMQVTPEEDLPENLRGEFNHILEELTTQGGIPETIAYMTKIEASNVAEEVLSLYDKIVKENSKQ
jgi:hypothetical protein